MDEEYLLINYDYLFRETPLNNTKSNFITKKSSTGRQNFPHVDHENTSFIREIDKSTNVEINHKSKGKTLNSFEVVDKDDDISVSSDISKPNSTTFKCFEQFDHTDDSDINYLKGTFYVNNLKSCEATKVNSGTKLLNGVLTHRTSLCSSNPRVKAISTCSSLLRHTVSMPNTRFIAQSNRQLKVSTNSWKAPIITHPDIHRNTPPQQLPHKPHRQIHLLPNHHKNIKPSKNTFPASYDDTCPESYSALEDHQYYARRTPASPPPAKRRSLMPQFKSSSASTINSAVTSMSNSNHANHINILQCTNDNYNNNHLNNNLIYTSYNNNNSCNKHHHNNNCNNTNYTNNKHNNKLLGGGACQSILETFLRATCPLDPNKGSTVALVAAQGMLNLSIEEEEHQDTKLEQSRNRSHNPRYTDNNNLLKKLLTGDIDSEATSGIETCTSETFASSPSSLSNTPLSSLSPSSLLSPISDSMETSSIFHVDSLLTDGFGLDADLTVDEKGGLHMQLDSEWHEDPFKMISSIERSGNWIKQDNPQCDCLTQDISDRL